MYNSKLINILQTFSQKEIREFEKFVCSPFFNKSKDIVNLIKILKAQHPAFSGQIIHREQLSKKLFGSKNYEEKKLRYAMSDLTKLAEDYISYSEFTSHKNLKKIYLLKGYDVHGLNKYFDFLFSEIKDDLEKQSFRNMTFFFESYLFRESAYLHTSKTKNRALETNLQAVINNLEKFYLTKGLRYYCEVINRKNILTIDCKLPFMEEMLKHFKKSGLNEVPAIEIYHTILLTLTQPDEESYYFDLLNLLDKHNTLFPVNELHDLYTFAQNYCVKKINSGNINYLRHLFELFKKLLLEDLLFNDNFLPSWYYKNIVTCALRLEEFIWAKEFIENYKKHIHPDQMENEYQYNMANLNFSTGEYRKAIKLLANVEFIDIFYQLDARALLLRAYYELDDLEALYSLIAAFKIYIKRNKLISEGYGKSYLNLINAVYHLVRYKEGKKILLSDIKKEVRELSPIANVTWINEKISEMENQNG